MENLNDKDNTVLIIRKLSNYIIETSQSGKKFNSYTVDLDYLKNLDGYPKNFNSIQWAVNHIFKYRDQYKLFGIRLVRGNPNLVCIFYKNRAVVMDSITTSHDVYKVCE